MSASGTKATVSLARQIRAIEAEIKMRRRVYPGRIERGTMTAAQMQRGIEDMEAVLATLQALAPQQGGLAL